MRLEQKTHQTEHTLHHRERRIAVAGDLTNSAVPPVARAHVGESEHQRGPERGGLAAPGSEGCAGDGHPLPERKHFCALRRRAPLVDERMVGAADIPERFKGGWPFSPYIGCACPSRMRLLSDRHTDRADGYVLTLAIPVAALRGEVDGLVDHHVDYVQRAASRVGLVIADRRNVVPGRDLRDVRCLGPQP